MLAAEFGGIRPWEMDRLTPHEELLIYQRYKALERAAQEAVT